MSDLFVASIGAVCFTQWFVAKKSKAEYFHCPMDNVENISKYQFLNLSELIARDFSQIRPDDLSYKEHKREAIADGELTMFRGYAYKGKELMTPVVLAHFLDRMEDEADAWGRWRHKCDVFDKTLKDLDKKILLVSVRMNWEKYEDTPEHCQYMRGDLDALSYILERKYKRLPNSLRVLSLVVVRFVDKPTVDYCSRLCRQVLVPAGDEADVPSWHRKPKQLYVDLANAGLDELNGKDFAL